MKGEEYREGDDWNESTDVGDVTTISRIAARPDIVVVVVDDVLRDVMAFPPTNEGCDDSCVGVVLIFFFSSAFAPPWSAVDMRRCRRWLYCVDMERMRGLVSSSIVVAFWRTMDLLTPDSESSMMMIIY